MPSGKPQGRASSLQDLSINLPSGFQSRVVLPRNPKMARDEVSTQTLTPSAFLREMSQTTEQRLANTREVRPPRIIELLDMSESSHQKFSGVELDQALFQPFPSEIVFQNYTPFETYEVPLVLRNNDQVPRLVKVTQESSPYFQIISPNDVCNKVAPGMASTFRILFTPEEKKDYFHEVICVTEREKFLVPVRAVGARAHLDLPDQLSFQICPVKYNSQKTLLVRNIGNREACFQLVTQRPFSVDPISGTLGVGESVQVTVNFQPQELGDHIQDLVIQYDTGEDVHMGLYGAASDVNVRLDKNSVMIEKTFVSLASQRTITIINRSDIITRFQWKALASPLEEDLQKSRLCSYLTNEEEVETDNFLQECSADPSHRERLTVLNRTFQNRRRLAQADSMLFTDDVFHVEPAEGEVWPNSSIEVQILFKPQEAKLYQRTIYCDITGREMRLPLRIRGEGLGPKLLFNFDKLDIGKIFAGSTHSYEVILTNHGAIDGIFSLTPPSNAVGSFLTFDPSEGIILPEGHQAIQISVCCGILGEFSQDFQFSVDGSPKALTLIIQGCVIGPTFHFSVPCLDFGDVAFGFPQALTCSLSNTSLVPMTFNLRIPGDGNGERSMASAQQILDDRVASWRRASHGAPRPQEFSINPSRGTIRSQGLLDIEVTLCSNQVKKYDVSLMVDVEGIGEEVLALPIIARCLVPSLGLDDPVLRFSRCFLNFPYQRTVTLSNPSHLPCCYFLLPQEPDAAPSVHYHSPAPRGIIGRLGSVDVPIVLEAQAVGDQNITAHFAVFGHTEPALELLLLCTGEGPVVQVSPSELDFGNIQVLTDVTRTLHLCNQSPIPASFQANVQTRRRSLWRIEPSCGEVPAEGDVDITLVAHLDDTVMFTDNITLVIGNSNTYHIPLHAAGIGTTIITDRTFAPILDLGSHFSAGPCRYHFTMTNRGHRTHQLYWMTEGFSQYRKRPQLPGVKSGAPNPEPPSPVFKLHPSRMELHPGQSIEVTLEGTSDVPKVVRERLMGQAIIGKQSGKEKIMTVDVTCEFIAPVLHLSARNLHFYVEKKPDDVMEPQHRPLTLKNISSLPLTTFLSVSRPFTIRCTGMGQDAGMKKACHLEVGEEMEFTVWFDPSYINDFLSRVAEEVLMIQYAEHPHIDYVSLEGEVNFPNLHFPSTHIDFGCILNDTECTQDLQVTNCSPFPVRYRWFYWTEQWESHRRENRLQTPGANQRIMVKTSNDVPQTHCTDPKALIPETRTDELHKGPELLQEGGKHTLTGVEEVFDILPMFGSLQPGESQTVSFTFYGHAGITAEAVALCEVYGGPTYEISLHGEASLICYVLSTKDIDYGMQPFNKVVETGLVLQNTGLVGFPFTVLNPTVSLQPGVPFIQPASGHIAAGGEETLKVSYFPGVPEPFQRAIQLQVAHLEPESIELHGEGVFPRICLDLHRVIIENERLQPYLREAEENMRDRAGLAPNMESPREEGNIATDTLLHMELERLILKDHAEDELLRGSYGDLSHGVQRKLLKAALPDYLLDFSFVILGDTKAQVIKITNTGHLPVSFHADRRGLSGTGFSTELDRVKNLPCVHTEIFHVKFDPRSANLGLGQVEVVMPIQVSGGPSFHVRLRASVTMPCLSVSSDRVEFSPVQCGQCQITSIQLYNQLLVPCKWNVIREEHKAKVDKHTPMHLRKKHRQEMKPKAVIFEMLPASGSLLPGEKKNVQIKFLPREEKLYRQHLVLQLAQSSQRVVLQVEGQGLEPRLDYSPSVLEMGPVLPLSLGQAMEVLVRNPCSFPIEFYSVEMDKQYLEEEKILRTLKGYDSLNTMLLPPRLPGEKLPSEILDFYEENKQLLEEETKSHEKGAAGVAEGTGVDPEQRREETECQPVPSPASGESRCSHNEVKSETAGSELVKREHSVEKVQDGKAAKVVGDLEYNPAFHAITRYLGNDPDSECQVAGNRRGIAIIMHGAPLTGKSSAAVVIAEHYGVACLIIDSVVLEAISDSNSPTGLKARQLCSKASLEQSLRETSDTALQAADGTGQSRLSVEALAKHTAEGGQGSDSRVAPHSVISRATRGNQGPGKSRLDGHGLQGAKLHHLAEPAGSQAGSSPLPPAPAQKRLSVSASVGGELGLVSCVLPEDLLQEILSERLQMNDCFRGVVFDGLDTLFARSSPAALQILLKALNNRRHIYFINLHQEYSALKAHEQEQRLQEEQERLRIKAQEKAHMEEMDEEEYDNLPEEERVHIDRLRLAAVQERKKREKEERQAREEREKKMREELLRQREEEELRKKNRRGRSRDSGKDDIGGKRSQMGVKQATNLLKLDQRMGSAMERKASLKERPDSVLNGSEDGCRRRRSKDPLPQISLPEDTDLSADADRQLIQQFKNYESSQRDITHILNVWDRMQGVLLSPIGMEDGQRDGEEQTPERQAPSGKKYRKDKERERQEKTEKERLERERAEKERLDKLRSMEQESSAHSVLEGDAQESCVELKPEVGVPVIECHVLGSYDPVDQRILRSGKLPSVEELLDGLGLGPAGPPLPPPCCFSVVTFPERRATSGNLETLSHFTFIAASPDDPNVTADEKKEPDPAEAEPALPIPPPKEEQLTPTKSRSKKEKPADPGRESQKDKRRPPSQRKSQSMADNLSPPPPARTPVSDVDPEGITAEAAPSKLQKLGTFRWTVPAGGEVLLRIHFASAVIGNFDQTLNFELLGTCRRYPLYCRGVCAFPSICQDPRVVFPHCKKEAKEDEINQKKFILSSGIFDFGPLLCGVSRDRYKAGRFPENMETIAICNISPMETEITFHFQYDMKATTFILDPPAMTLKPTEKQMLSIWAYPTSPGGFEDSIVCCIKDNPLPVVFRISCSGFRPELELDRKTIHFDRVLLHRKATRTIFLRNSNLLPVTWRVTGLENLGDEFSVSQDQGIVGPRSQYGFQVHFKASKAINVKKQIRLEVTDVQNISGTFHLEPILILAEPYDVSLDISFPKGTDGGLDFGVVKVNEEAKHTISLKNKGTYEIGFSFSLEPTDPGMPDLSSLFVVTPQKGSLGHTQVQIRFQAKSEVEIVEKAILQCKVIEPSLGAGGLEIASIPIRVSACSAFSKYRLSPCSDINFGAMVLGSRKLCSFTLENTSKLEFRYSISKMIREVIIQPAKKGLVHGVKRVRSREGSGSSKSISLNKVKRTDSQTRDMSTAGQARLTLGIFIVSPGFGSVPPGAQYTINVDCTPDQLGRSEELLSIDISDRDPDDHPSGIPFRLVTEVCTPGFVTDDVGSIFEEHRVVTDARFLQYLPSLQNGGVYLQEENRFLFCNVLVGHSSIARFKILNAGKVPCEVILSLKPISAKVAYRISDLFDIEPQRMSIPSHSHGFVSVTFSPQSMMLYQCVLDVALDGVGSALSKTRNLTFEISGEGNLPRVTVVRPVLRNMHGQPLLLFQRLLIGQQQQLPLILKNEGFIPAQLNIDLEGDAQTFKLKPKSATQCIYPAWRAEEGGAQSTGRRAHTASLIMHPGDTAEFEVVFYPAAPRRSEASLTLVVLDNQYDRNCVQLVGEGYQDDLTIDNIQSPGNTTTTTGPILEELIEAPRSDHIILGDCHIGRPYEVTFTMTNRSELDTMRFEWPSDGPLSFSPQVGHIHASCAKHITVTLRSEAPVVLTRSPVQCRVSRISFPLPLDEISDWDVGMRTVKWVDNVTGCAEQGRTKRKVIEPDPEPRHVVLDGGSREIELLVSASVGHAQYAANCEQVHFKDTLLYQTRVFRFHMQNSGPVQLQFSWQVQMEIQDPGIQSSPRPAALEEPLGSRRSSSSRAGSVLESVSSMLSVGCGGQPFSVQPGSGVIPAGEAQEFLIKFCPLEVGDFMGRLVCSIPNLSADQHEPVLPVKGHSVLPYCHFLLEDSDYINNRRRNPELGGPHGAPSGTTLDPNTRVIEFNSVGVRTKSTRKFSILNPTNGPYSFLWTCEDASGFQSSPDFHCLNDHGVIQSEKKVEVAFEFLPRVVGITESFWSFTLPEQKIQVPFLLVGKAIEPCVSLDRSHLNFRSLLVGHKAEETLYIINNEDKLFTFSIRESSCYSEGCVQRLVVNPMEGTVSPHTRMPVIIAVRLTQPGSVNFKLTCDVQTKTEPLYLNVKAEGHSAEVCFQYQDSTGSVTTLSTLGPNQIDLGQVDVNDRSMSSFNVMNNGRFPFSYSCALNAPAGVCDYMSVSPAGGCVEPGQRAQCSFSFHPIKTCKVQDAELQIKVAAGPEVRCSIHAVAVRPGIHFSFKQHNFGNCFVYQVGMNPVQKTLVISNKDDREISLDCLYDNTAHLEVDFHSNMLPPGGKMEIPIRLYPRTPVLYQETLVFQMNSHTRQLVHVQGRGIEMKVEVADPKYRVTSFGAVRVGETVKKSVPVVNNSACPVSCTFSLSPNAPALQDIKVLALSPSTEVIIPPHGGLCKLEMCFSPKCRVVPFAEEVIFEAAGVTRSLLVLRGSSQGLELSLDQEFISFGAVVLLSHVTRRVVLSNTGELGARFQWDVKSFRPDFSISPPSGYITAGSDVTFEIVFHPKELNADIRYERLPCLIEGSRALTLTLSGSCITQTSTKEVIHFQCQVRSRQTQSVLLSNKTNHAWNLHPVIDGEHWRGTDSVMVDAQQHGKPYDITYCPMTMTSEGKKHQGSVFFPLPDGTGLMYLLQGVADPPKSTSNIVREVPCKTLYTELLPVSNWLNKTQRFRVTVDMVKPERLDITTTIKGLDYLEVPAAAKRDYKLCFHSHKEGTFSAKVVFRNETSQEYLFYFLTFKATSPGITSTIEMVTPVRQSTAATVKVDNPLSVPVTFITECRVPEINLPPHLTVPAQSEGSLMFEFQPLKAGESVGRLTLQSNDLGLFQYDLHLKAMPALPEKPLYFRTSLGSNQTLCAKIINYTRQKTEYSCKVDNSDFHVEKVVMAAPGSQGGSEVSVEVTYEPVQLGETRALLLLSSPLGGEYSIPLLGSALPPKPQGPLLIRAGSSISIAFKNVFLQPTTFTFQTDPPAFTAKPSEQVRPKKTHYISVGFEAPANGSKLPVTGKLVVSCPRVTGSAQGIYWVYYLKGVATEK